MGHYSGTAREAREKQTVGHENVITAAAPYETLRRGHRKYGPTTSVLLTIAR